MNNPPALLCVIGALVFLAIGRLLKIEGLPVSIVSYAGSLGLTAWALWITFTGRGRRD